MAVETVRIDRVDTTATSTPGRKRHLVTASGADGLLRQYVTIDDTLAAQAIAASYSKQEVEVRWRATQWGQKIIALTFVDECIEVFGPPSGQPNVVPTFVEGQDRAEFEEAERALCEGCGLMNARNEHGRYVRAVLVHGEGYWHRTCYKRSTGRNL